MMKRVLSITLLTTLTTLAILSQPKISVDKKELDLGTIYAGMKKKGAIVIKNIGSDTLRIISIQPSCGCTAVKQPKQVLLPNESDVIEVELNTSGFHGRVEKHINITSNDPETQYLLLKLIAEIREELKPVAGSSLTWFGSLEIGKTAERIISFVNTSERKLTIKDFKSTLSSINIELSKKNLLPNDTLNIKVTVKVEKAGYNTETIRIETDSKNQPFLEFRVAFLGITKEN